MRGILLVLLAIGLVAVAAPPAVAHEQGCWFGDFGCYLKCEISHVKYPNDPSHGCYWIVDP